MIDNEFFSRIRELLYIKLGSSDSIIENEVEYSNNCVICSLKGVHNNFNFNFFLNYRSEVVNKKVKVEYISPFAIVNKVFDIKKYKSLNLLEEAVTDWIVEELSYYC